MAIYQRDTKETFFRFSFFVCLCDAGMKLLRFDWRR
jgi:hypothetical protein